MSYSSASQRYIIKVLGAQFGLSSGAVEEFLSDERTYASINDFLKGDERVPKLLFFYQVRDSFTEDGEFIEASGAGCQPPLIFFHCESMVVSTESACRIPPWPRRVAMVAPTTDPPRCVSLPHVPPRASPILPASLAESESAQLFLTTGEMDPQKGPAVFFLRNTKPGVEVPDGKPEEGLSTGTLPARAMEGLQAMLSQLYLPIVEGESKGWKVGVGVDDSTAEFFASYHTFGETLGEAVSSLQGGFTLRRPDNLFDIENKAAAFSRASNEANIVKAFEDVAEEWCSETEKLLAENDTARS
jgi:hypothetical protein